MNTEAQITGRCLGCDYPLRGLDRTRCPECGREFDPGNPKTMNMNPPVRAVWRWLMKPPGRVWQLLLAVPVGLWLYAGVWPGFYLGSFVLAFLLSLALGGVWLLRLVLAGVLVNIFKQQLLHTWVVWRKWLVTPVVFLLLLGILKLHIPSRVALWWLRPTAVRLAQRVQAAAVAQGVTVWTMTQPGTQPPGTQPAFVSNQWVGPYYAQDISPLPNGGVWFWVNGTGFLGEEGLAYSPAGDPRAYLTSIDVRVGRELGQGWWLLWSHD